MGKIQLQLFLTVQSQTAIRRMSKNMNDKKNVTVDVKAQIMGAFSTCSKTDINFALQILELLLNQEKQIQSDLFQFVCEIWGTVKSSEEIEVPEKISVATYEKLKSLYGDVVNQVLLSYIRKGIAENWNREQFYEYLWNYISTNVMWSTNEEKAFALYYIAIDVRSPYYNVGVGLKMSEDDYSKIQDEIFDAYREFRFIIALDIHERTEEASMVLRLLDHMETDEQKIVLMSRILAYYKNEIQRIMDRVKSGR